MAEYIEREALERSLNERVESLRRMYGNYDAFTAGFDECIGRVEEFPSADVAPVRYGRWDDSGRYQFPSGAKAIRCSICGCALSESEYRLFNWNYCPVCGAKMDLEGGDGA